MAFKLLLKNLFYVSGIPSFIRKFFLKKCLFIFNYHSVIESPLKVPDFCFIEKNRFEMQLSYLKKHFDILKMNDGLKKLYSKNINRPSAIITFDDGFQNNFELAFPILCKLDIPATIFLSTGLIDTDQTLWFCKLHNAIEDTNMTSITYKEKEYKLSGTKNKMDANYRLQEVLKSFPSEILDRELNTIISKLGFNKDKQYTINSIYRMLNYSSITKMHKSGLVDFGCHTHNHSILSKICFHDCIEEINKSKKMLQNLNLHNCNLFAFPNGKPSDIPKDSNEILKHCNIDFAFTTIPGPNDFRSAPYNIKRFCINSFQSNIDFKLMTTGYKYFKTKLENRLEN